MTETEIINKRLAQHGRTAYEKAKSQDNAFIVIGNGIYRMLAGGDRYRVEELTTTRVKAKLKRFEIK